GAAAAAPRSPADPAVDAITADGRGGAPGLYRTLSGRRTRYRLRRARRRLRRRCRPARRTPDRRLRRHPRPGPAQPDQRRNPPTHGRPVRQRLRLHLPLPRPAEGGAGRRPGDPHARGRRRALPDRRPLRPPGSPPPAADLVAGGTDAPATASPHTRAATRPVGSAGRHSVLSAIIAASRWRQLVGEKCFLDRCALTFTYRPALLPSASF